VVASAGGTVAASINQQGEITGYFIDSNLLIHGFVLAPDGKYTTFEAPGAALMGSYVGAGAFSINSFGAVTGESIDANNAMHGFSRSPIGTFAPFNAPHAGTAAGQGTRPPTNNLQGAVAGWYVDANNVNHGFLWLP